MTTPMQLQPQLICGSSRARYFAYLLLLPLIMLNIPKLSTAIALGCVYEVVITSLLLRFATARFAARLLLLASFTVSYYLVSYGHGFIEIGNAAKYAMYLVGLYILGYSVGMRSCRNWPQGLVWPILSMIAGGVLFSFFCVLFDLRATGLLQVENRAVPSFWSGGELINGPGLGSLASLGICLLPAALLSRSESATRKESALFLGVSVVLFAAGSFANLALQNRSPFVALAIAFAACVGLGVVRGGALGRRVLFRLVVLAAAGGALVIAFAGADLLDKFTIFSRFAERGLSTTGRSSAWLAMVTGLFDSLAGGRVVDIGGIVYVHNLWLDVAYDTGIAPLLFLLLFHGAHLGCFARVVRSGLPANLVMLILCVGVSYLAAFAVEPALNFSAIYVSSSSFFLGLLLRLSEEMATPAAIGDGEGDAYAGN